MDIEPDDIPCEVDAELSRRVGLVNTHDPSYYGAIRLVSLVTFSLV